MSVVQESAASAVLPDLFDHGAPRSFQVEADQYLRGLVSRTMKLSDAARPAVKKLEGQQEPCAPQGEKPAHVGYSPRNTGHDVNRQMQGGPTCSKQEGGLLKPSKEHMSGNRAADSSAASKQSSLAGLLLLPPKQAAATPGKPNRHARNNEEEGPSPGTVVTTLMIRNIPCKLTLKAMMDLINSYGFAGKYDLLHLPGKGQPFSNLGYAFINFFSPATVDAFEAKFQGIAFNTISKISTEKVVEVRPARAQGFAENMSKVRHIMTKNIGPSVFAVVNGQSWIM